MNEDTRASASPTGGQGPVQRFFQVIPPGTNFPFVGKRWTFLWGSILMIALSAAVLIFNQVKYGAPLNWGIDFAGGSSVRLQLDKSKAPPIEEIRGALEQLGYEGSQAVTVPDTDGEVLIRVKEVVSIDDATLAACEAAVKTVGDAKLVGFQHPEGASKLFLKYDAEPSRKDIEDKINAAGCEGTADKGFEVREGEYPVEVSLIGVGSKITEQLDAKFGKGTVVAVVHAETVGAKVGDQLKTDGAKSLLYAMGFIFLYVMIRFDLRFAPGGIVALAHDAFITVGAFALTWKEFSLTTIAAILTIVGYSINDTIVVFDRVRERVALFRDDPIEDSTNRALNDTLSRTILTSGTTLLSVIATYVMGSGSIEDFSFALIIGIAVGTYSSLFVATPVFLWVNKRFYGGQGHLHWRHDGPEGDRPAGAERPVLAAGEAEVDEETGRPVSEIRQEQAAAEEAAEAEAAREDGDGPEGGLAPRTTRRRRRRPQ